MKDKVRQDEVAGSFAIVGCDENPNFQVWGARSDLKCVGKKKKNMLKMNFKDWVGNQGRGGRCPTKKVV